MNEVVGESLFWPEERWRALQARRLGEHLRRARERELYRGAGVGGAEIRDDIDWLGAEGLEKALAALPFTTKDQLAGATAEDLFGADLERVAEWVCTSGTMGKPLDVALTRADVERLARNEAAALSLAGIGKGDLVIVAVGMERMFVAGLAYWLGARRLGAACVRVGPRVAEQAGMVRELCGRLAVGEQKVFIIGVPSYLVNVEPPESKLSGIVAIGEPVKRSVDEGGGAGRRLEYNALGAKLHERFGCAVMSTYAMTETCTTFAEGPLCEGGHLNPELGIVECVDEGGMAVKSGKVGEIVVTPLGVEGMPLVRFKTGDMAAVFSGKCACGRTTPRVGPIVGRRGQLLKVRGVSVYPNTIVEAIRGTAGVVDCAVVAEEAEALSDRVTVFVHAAEATGEHRQELEGKLRAVIRVVPEVRYVGAAELLGLQMSGGRGGRKVSRFVDRRGK